MSRRATCLLVLLFGLTMPVSCAAAATAAGPVGGDFFGVVPQALLSNRDLERMQGTVGTLRIPVVWSWVEPRPESFELEGLDEIVGDAAAHGISVLPFVYGSPVWLTGDPARPPTGSAAARVAWTGFLRLLVHRYGPKGTFWRGRESPLPIRRWQIWNEPNFPLFWSPRPSPAGYARLLHWSARAIRGVDPSATIVAAGLAPVETGIPPWTFLRRMYEVQGVRHDFEVAALHPYAPYVRWVAEEIRLVREAMAAGGDARKPLQLTEIGVASAGAFPNPFDKGRRGQARFLRRVFRLAIQGRRRWHIAGVDWFTWSDGPALDPHCVFCQYAGLFDAGGDPKPSWSAYVKVVARADAAAFR